VNHDSFVRVRKPYVMLVRIEPGEEPAALGLRELSGAVRVVHVRHPIPACERMRVLRPLVVIVGESVRAWAMPCLEEAATDVDAAVLPLGPLVATEALRDWLRRALERGLERRARKQTGSAGRAAGGGAASR